MRTVCLPTSTCSDTDTCFTGRSSVVAGWGTLKSDGPTPRQVQHVTVPVVENAQCDRFYQAGSFPRGTITSKMICAGYTSGGKDSCQVRQNGSMVVWTCGVSYETGRFLSFNVIVARPGIEAHI